MQLRQNRKLLVLTALLASLLAWPALAGPYVLFDVGSGRVLAEEDAFKRWYPASLTKLMTVYVTFRALGAGEIRLDSPVRISAKAAKEPPSKMGYAPGSVLTLDNALKVLLVKSANDIAMAVAENVAGSEAAFVARMNAEARRLGMTGTHYVNPHGLHSPEQYTTARDLALLVRAIRTEFPQYAPYFAIEGVRQGKKVIENTNFLIGRFDGADGMKTGYVCSSGFNLVATATRHRRTLAAVVLGAHSQVERAKLAAELLTRGFKGGGFGAPVLASLRPSAVDRDVATDMRSEICSKEAVAARFKLRDDEGRLVLDSPYVRPRNHAPNLVVVSLSGTAPRYVDVPIPTPRPNYPSQTVSTSTAEGD